MTAELKTKRRAAAADADAEKRKSDIAAAMRRRSAGKEEPIRGGR